MSATATFEQGPTSAREAAVEQLRLFVRRLLLQPLAVLGLAIILLLVLVAVFAPWLASHSPLAQALDRTLQPPGAEHWFGTDELGRDIYSRILYGSRYTLLIVFLVSITVAPIGLVVGCVAGYLGGWTDTVLMRITDLFLSFPGLALALAFVAALGAGLENAIFAIALTAWPPIARLARAETLTIRASEYIAAVRLMGASSTRIVLKHVLPMCLPSVIVRLTLNMAGIILTAAGLGFLGLGAQPPVPEWGAMTSTGRNFLLDAWWLAGIPGIAILLVSLAFNLLGDGLRDTLDPRGE
jgi:peptide/nickel transport system permease protein